MPAEVCRFLSPRPGGCYVDGTLGGFVMTQLARIPESGESFIHENVRFTAEKVVRHRVLLVRVTPLEEKD